MGSIFVSFFALLFLGAPIAVVMGLVATIQLLVAGDVPLRVIPQRLFAGLDQFVLMSIPFFMIGGFLMNDAQLTGRLVQFANHLVGRWRGGLAQVTVVTCMFFGGVTGAASAEAAAVGSIMIPAMVGERYRREFATALTVAASVMGPLIPPSIPMLVYGIASHASIGALFLSGVTPGVAVGLSFLALNRFVLTRELPPTEAVDASRRVETLGARLVGFVSSLRAAVVALVMPLIIVGGVVGGIFTPTESSAMAVLYALAVGLAMRTLETARVLKTLAATTVLSATIMFIIANANVLGWVLTIHQIPQAVAEALLAFTDSPAVFLLFVIVLLLIVGLFLETSGSIILFTPILLPAANSYGIDPVHFGVVMVFGLVIGLLTPPFGLCLFIGSAVGRVPIHVLSRELVPFLAVLIGLYLVFTYVPEASLWLPRLLE